MEEALYRAGNPWFFVLPLLLLPHSTKFMKNVTLTAHERGITSITISQRLALEAFHDRELRMGNANGDKVYLFKGTCAGTLRVRCCGVLVSMI